ncbi:MAG: hypothetical protein ABI639_16225 [Thermoanaerobaculia bacterium]
MTAPVTPAMRRSARALQALAGVVITSIGVGSFDWRAGVVAFGLLILATSAVWRNVK